jgi:hypothetical protein
MSNRDKNDRELQVAAVELTQRHSVGSHKGISNQKNVADILKRLYPTRYDRILVTP